MGLRTSCVRAWCKAATSRTASRPGGRRSRSWEAGESVGNQVEDAAIKLVVTSETAEGREARDTRWEPNAPTDLVSGDRLRSQGVRRFGPGHDPWLEVAQVEAALASPGRFWLYVVDNVSQGDPEQFRLLRLGGATGRACWPSARNGATTKSPSR
jgi:hypothetical protein